MKQNWSSSLLTFQDAFQSTLLGSKKLHSLTNHPVHVLDENGNLSTTALIPFCMFGGKLSTMGIKIPQVGIPVCNTLCLPLGFWSLEPSRVIWGAPSFGTIHILIFTMDVINFKNLKGVPKKIWSMFFEAGVKNNPVIEYTISFLRGCLRPASLSKYTNRKLTARFTGKGIQMTWCFRTTFFTTESTSNICNFKKHKTQGFRVELQVSQIKQDRFWGFQVSGFSGFR